MREAFLGKIIYLAVLGHILLEIVGFHCVFVVFLYVVGNPLVYFLE